jgi:thiol-disulfide isomerase/thioredoxin
MNKALVLLSVGIVVLIAGSFIYLNSSPSDANRTEQSADSSSASKPEPTSSDSKGKYIDYSESALSQAEGTRILFFHAPWCSQCRVLEADIQQRGLPDGVTVLKVDYDTNQELRQRYGVTVQTTLVLVDNEDQMVKKYVAYQEPTVDSIKENLL